MNEKKNISYRTFKSNIITQYALMRIDSSILGTSNLLKVFNPAVRVVRSSATLNYDGEA